MIELKRSYALYYEKSSSTKYHIWHYNSDTLMFNKCLHFTRLISFNSNGREKFWRMFCSLLVIYHVVVYRGEVGLFLKEKYTSRITSLFCKRKIAYNKITQDSLCFDFNLLMITFFEQTNLFVENKAHVYLVLKKLHRTSYMRKKSLKSDFND